MPIFKPTLRFNRITDIAPVFLQERKITTLLLDVDNTLTKHNSHEVTEDIRAWLNSLKDFNINPIIYSNNKKGRIEPLAKDLNLKFIYSAKKPLKGKFKTTLKNLGVKPESAAIVGDQIFTDILGGNRAKITTIFVNYISPESGWFFKLKRRFERMVLK